LLNLHFVKFVSMCH